MKRNLSKSVLVLAALMLLNGYCGTCYASPFDEDSDTIEITEKTNDTKVSNKEETTEKKGFWSKVGGILKKGAKAAKKGASTVKNTVVKGYEKVSGAITSLAKKKDADYIVESIFLPGHDSKEMVCQGIAYLPETVMDANQQAEGVNCRYVLLSYYPKNSDQPSQILVVDRQTQKAVKRFALYKSNGKAYTGHAGGIAVAGKYLWVASGGTIFGFEVQEIIDFISDNKTKASAVSGLPDSMDKLPGKDLTAVKTYSVDSKASFVSFDGKYIWVGDFTKGSNYKPIKHHNIFGRNNWIAGYLVDSDGYPTSTVEYTYKDGDDTETVHKPDAVIAMRESVQGMAICGDYAALTVSYGATNSKLAIYDNPLKKDSETIKYKPEGQSKSYIVEAWELKDGKNWIETVKLAAGAEDLEYDGENLYVTFECSSKNYRTKWSLNPLVKITDDFYLVNPKVIADKK